MDYHSISEQHPKAFTHKTNKSCMGFSTYRMLNLIFNSQGE